LGIPLSVTSRRIQATIKQVIGDRSEAISKRKVSGYRSQVTSRRFQAARRKSSLIEGLFHTIIL
jgi:hypothetical protein